MLLSINGYKKQYTLNIHAKCFLYVLYDSKFFLYLCNV